MNENRDQNRLPVDLSYLLDALGGDKAKIKAFASVLLESYPNQIIKMKEAAEKKDVLLFKCAVHKFKGAVSYFNMNRVHAIISELEKRTLEPMEESLTHKLKELEDEMDSVRRYLQSYE